MVSGHMLGRSKKKRRFFFGQRKKRKPKGVQGKQPGLLEQTDWSQEEEWMDQGVTRTLDGYYQGKPMYEYDFPEKDSKKVTKRDTPRQRKDKESKQNNS